MEKWAVIACDQFTSDPAYWARVAETAGDAPSTLRLILPEAELGTPQEAAHTEEINRTMEAYLANGLFRTYENSFVYVERTALSARAWWAWWTWRLMTTTPAPPLPSVPRSGR